MHKMCLHLNPLAQPGGVPGSGLLGTWPPRTLVREGRVKELC